MKWQRTARLIIAVVGIAFAIGVGMNMRRRNTPHTAPLVPRADPNAVV